MSHHCEMVNKIRQAKKYSIFVQGKQMYAGCVAGRSQRLYPAPAIHAALR
jgi:hypothetical protein